VTAALARRRRVVAATSVAGAALLGLSLAAEPGSRRFYALTFGVAGVWTVGALTSGPVPIAGRRTDNHISQLRAVGDPLVIGTSAFAAFYAAARVARHVPALDRALNAVMRYAHEGSEDLVLASALVNGIAEELFFRGALYDAAGSEHPVAVSTAAYVVATAATRNPALVAASAVMGALFAAQRRTSQGVRAPIITHLTWSTLMLRRLPPLFERR
jgi:membrane protease YdiL (CAAX protease family)